MQLNKYLASPAIVTLVATLCSCSSSEFVYPPLFDEPAVISPDEDIGSSFRIGTYNAQFLVTPAPSWSECCTDISPERRVELLAERIIASPYDVLVMQEGFDDTLQDELANRLKDRFPHFVKYLDDGGGHLQLPEHLVDLLIANRAGPETVTDPDTHLPILPPPPLRPRYGSGCVPLSDCQDSGLLIFSRFPFVELPPPKATIVDPSAVRASRNGTEWRDVAFIEHRVCEGQADDCKARKGVGLVRIQHPDGTIYSVVFTHLDAGGGQLGEKVRRLQLILIEQFVEATLGPSNTITDQLIFVGDLNINGDLASPARDGLTPTEWERHFSPGGSGESEFFHSFVQDTWGFGRQDASMLDIKQRDRGLTSSTHSPRNRIDYIFRSFAPSIINDPLCVQHTTLAYNLYQFGPGYETGFGLGGIRPLSDHLGVNADINLPAPYCSSNQAFKMDPSVFSDPSGTLTIAGSNTLLRFPGSVQWYLIENSGTYSIRLNGHPSLEYQVYKSTDLTRALNPYLGQQTDFQDENGTQVSGRTFVSADFPLYVKVYSDDRTWTGSYELILHRHSCRSFEDRCRLLPNQEASVKFPNPSIAASPQPLFFSVDTDAPLNEQAQELRFLVSHNAAGSRVSPSNLYQLALYDGSSRMSLANSGTQALIERADASDNRKELLLLVTKLDPAAPNSAYVEWRTNLRLLRLGGIYALQETDDLGGGDEDDEVLLQVYVNALSAFDMRPNIGDFRQHTFRPLGATVRCPIGYLSLTSTELAFTEPVIFLDEDDPGSNDLLRGIVPNTLGAELVIDVREVEETSRPPGVGELPSPSGHGYELDGIGHYRLVYTLESGTQTMDQSAAWKTAVGVACQERQSVDNDNDGIVDSVDLATVRSDQFTDDMPGLHGATSGKIIERAGRTWLVRDEPDDPSTTIIEGVRITVGAGLTEGVLEFLPRGSTVCPRTIVRVPASGTSQEFVESC